MKKVLTSCLKCARILPVSERKTTENMMNQYCVLDEDGLYRMFDVSHDGLEDAIEFAHKIDGEVIRDNADGESEVVWSSEDAEPREDNFRDDAEADADALAMAGFGTDEDYGCYDSGDDYACEW